MPLARPVEGASKPIELITTGIVSTKLLSSLCCPGVVKNSNSPSTLYKRGVISEQEYINRLKLAENQRIACEKNN